MTKQVMQQAIEALCEVPSKFGTCSAAIAALREAIATNDAAQCTWSESDPWGDVPSTYDSTCGELWSFIDGGPKENKVKFCHGCGGVVVVVPFVDEALEGTAPSKPNN